MQSNIETKKRSLKQWKWFVGLYAGSLVGYGIIEIGLHYLNSALKYL